MGLATSAEAFKEKHGAFISEHLSILEGLRKAKVPLAYLVLILFIALGGAGFFGTIQLVSWFDVPKWIGVILNLGVGFFGVWGGLSIVGYVLYSVILDPYRNRYKELISTFLGELGLEVTYDPTRGINIPAFRNSLIYENYPPSEVDVEDLVLIEQPAQGLYMASCELSSTVGVGKSSWNQFSGLFGLVMLEEESERLLIIRDVDSASHRGPAILGNPYEKYAEKQGWEQEVGTGNAAFDEAFQVYTPDPEQARSFLTPNRQGRLLELRELVEKDISISLRQMALYFAIASGGDAFDPPHFRKVSMEHLHRDLWRLEMLASLPDFLEIETGTVNPAHWEALKEDIEDFDEAFGEEAEEKEA